MRAGLPGLMRRSGSFGEVRSQADLGTEITDGLHAEPACFRLQARHPRITPLAVSRITGNHADRRVGRVWVDQVSA
jgi:hypothetical protein